MTREEAKAILKGFMENPLYSDIPRVCRAFDMAIKVLEQTTWIPVSDRLPEGEGWYLTSLGDKTYGGADVDMHCKGWVKYGTHVLAWMPLPEPYAPTN